MDKQREELRQALDFNGCPVCRECNVLEAMDAYIKSRESALRDENNRLRDALKTLVDEWHKKHKGGNLMKFVPCEILDAEQALRGDK